MARSGDCDIDIKLQRFLEKHLGHCVNPITFATDKVNGSFWLLSSGCFVGVRAHYKDARKHVEGGDDMDEVDVLDAFGAKTGAIRAILGLVGTASPHRSDLTLELSCIPSRQQVEALDNLVGKCVRQGYVVDLLVSDRQTGAEDIVEGARSVFDSKVFKRMSKKVVGAST